MANRRRLLEDLRDAAETITINRGFYNQVIRSHFPEIERHLPIIAEDFCYTMDVMFMRALGIENTEETEKTVAGERRVTYKIKDRKTKGKLIEVADEENLGAHDYAPPWTCALIIVETTSRKAWAYPMHSKDAREVLYCFKKFLADIEFRISRLITDSGREYSLVKKYNETFIELHDDHSALFKYFQVNASQNAHTSLSRVDRFIRTLRGMLRNYYSIARNGNWVAMLKYLIKRYNNSPHSSLTAGRGENKRFYTPDQVYFNPEVRRQQKLIDYLKKYRNYAYFDQNFRPGVLVHYRVLPGQMRDRRHKGFMSQYPAIIRERVGNSYRIQMKTEADIVADRESGKPENFNGPIVVAPGRDLILKKKVARPGNSRSKYRLFDMMNGVYDEMDDQIREIDEDEANRSDDDESMEDEDGGDDDDDEGDVPPPDDEVGDEEEEEDEPPPPAPKRNNANIDRANILPSGVKRERRTPNTFHFSQFNKRK